MHPRTIRIHEIGARPHANLRRYSADRPAPNIPYAPGPDATSSYVAIPGFYLSAAGSFGTTACDDPSRGTLRRPSESVSFKEQLPVTCVRWLSQWMNPNDALAFPQ